MKILLSLLVSICIFNLSGQNGWTWEELPPMPEPIANNAVCEGYVGDTAFVYSFSGIDTTKLYSGINLRSMCYNSITQVWSDLPDLPDTLGKIAAGASYVNDKIYIIGGYHVFSNSSEISSDKVHIFDPVTNTYLADGAPIPVPIDDQVQAVWRDSLIYVVTGWSTNGNVNDVQIYNPFLDEWTAGTSTPNNNIYRAFGASGVIIGDTIFYNGGATGGQFNSTGRLRKGVINPNNPTEITWTELGDNPGDEGYRMAAVSVDDKAFWIGGSGTTYNFNGIAYNGTGGVPPLHRILRYNSSQGTWSEGLGEPFGIMDLRGAAKISPTKFIICGGMEENQKVTDRSFLLTFDPLNSLDPINQNSFKAYPNPFSSHVILPNNFDLIEIYSSEGKLILRKEINKNVLDLTDLPSGFYEFKYFKDDQVWSDKMIKN